MLHSFSNTFSLAHILQTLPNRVLIEFDCWWFLKQCQIIILKAPQKGHQVQQRMTTCQLSDSYPTVHSQTVWRLEMLGHCTNPRRPSHCIIRVPIAVRDGPHCPFRLNHWQPHHNWSHAATTMEQIWANGTKGTNTKIKSYQLYIHISNFLSLGPRTSTSCLWRPTREEQSLMLAAIRRRPCKLHHQY